MNLDVSYVLSCAFKQSSWIAQGRSAKETKLNICRGRVNVHDGPVAADPASVSPLHGFPEARFSALHEQPKRTNNRLILRILILEVIVEARIRLHLCHQ